MLSPKALWYLGGACSNSIVVINYMNLRKLLLLHPQSFYFANQAKS